MIPLIAMFTMKAEEVSVSDQQRAALIGSQPIIICIYSCLQKMLIINSNLFELFTQLARTKYLSSLMIAITLTEKSPV